ncbi:MAG TPA: ATP-grasp domain-containing protein [candidate division Zixibacteria bacterium]|nr:ATP-grasp domain-containing protein [candidate division Zixibacteria bacterium]
MKKVLIVDYIVGGGFAEDDLPMDRLAEGYAVLRACVEQFSLLGYKITTLIDQRLMQHIRIAPIHDFISVSTTEDFINGLNHFADEVDYSITSAPESKGILKDLSSIMINSNSLYLGSKPESIEIAADKIKTMEIAKKLELNVPATFSPLYSDSFEKILNEVDILGYPLIIKPIDGISCQGLTKATNANGLGFGLQAAHAVTSMENCIVQEFIEGVPISTSLIANEDSVYPLSINHQNLRISSQNNVGHYLGGEVPYDVPEYHDEIIESSIKLVKEIGLRGCVGVDFVVGEEGVFVIEVNPRITVPFIALKEIANQNLAQALIDVIENDKKDLDIKLNGYATFSKISIPSTIGKQSRYEKITGIDGVLSPPLPIGTNSHAYSLILGIGPTISLARKDFQRVKNQVLENIST